jgi:hypothetical protein
VDGGKVQPRRSYLSEVNFVSKKISPLLFGGQLELVKNAIIIDGWLKFKVSDIKEIAEKVALSTMQCWFCPTRLLGNVMGTFVSSEEKYQP